MKIFNKIAWSNYWFIIVLLIIINNVGEVIYKLNFKLIIYYIKALVV